MSLRVKLIWAFVLVALGALVLAVLGLNAGMRTSMLVMHRGPMMMRGQPWMLVDVEALQATILRWSLFSSLTALAIAGLIGWWTAGRITRSLVHLRDAASHLDLRDLTRRVPVEGNDEIAELAQAFNRMSDRLQAEERARRQLLADVAHELRHPLAVLQGRLEMMQDGMVAPTPEAFVPLQDEIIRLTRLVGDLRDLSLAEVGGLSLHRAPVQVESVLEGLLANLEPVAAAKDIELAAEMPSDLPAISADPDRLRQVFVNLLANALQYTPERGQVQVRAWHEAGRVLVRICDTGPGIPPEDLPHIFDRFYRADKSRSRSTGGSGLGLAIVRSLVELHQGQVRVQSKVGEGTCFTVVLPVQPGTQTDSS